MAKTLSELIQDAAASDDTQFTTPDGTIYRLGDVRTFRNEVMTEKNAAKVAREQAEKTAKDAKDIFDALTQAKAELDKQNAPPPDKRKSDWKKNPLYDELVPVLEAAEAAANEARETANNLKKSLDQSQAIYALERLRRQWAESKVKPSNKKFEEVVAEVIASKELDEMGLPTLEKYLYRTSEPERIKAATEEAVANAKKEWEKAQRAADIPKPGKFNVRVSDKPPIAKIEDLNSQIVANDPDIIAAMEGTSH